MLKFFNIILSIFTGNTFSLNTLVSSIYTSRENSCSLVFDFEDISPETVHVRQRCNWDCGVASIGMALKWGGLPFSYENVITDICKLNRPLWTIDMYVYLNEHSLKVIISP